VHRFLSQPVRERNGNSVPAVSGTEGQALNWIKARVNVGTVVNADEAPAYNDLRQLLESLRMRMQPDAPAFRGIGEPFPERPEP